MNKAILKKKCDQAEMTLKWVVKFGMNVGMFRYDF